MSVELRGIKTPAGLMEWVRRNSIKAIYVDSDLRNFESETWELIRRNIGKGLEVGLRTEDDGIQVLLVSDS